MDAGAFLQENRRWVTGCVLGVVVYFVGGLVISSIYDAQEVHNKAVSLGRGITKDPLYGQAALDAAKVEGQQDAEELQRLRAELVFQPDEKYVLQGKAMAPDEYFSQVGHKLRTTLLQQTQSKDVTLTDSNLQWSSKAEPEAIRGTLFGLNLIEAIVGRLLAANDEVRKGNDEAMGLVEITALKLEDSQRGIRQIRQAKTGEVDVRDLLEQQKVTFSFQSDSATAYLFLEKCRQPGKTLVLDNLIMKAERPGGPVKVTGALLGIAFKEGQ